MMKLMREAEKDLEEINDDLDLQGEKLHGIHKRVTVFSKEVYRNKLSILRLKESLGIKKFVFPLVIIAALFGITVVMIKYPESVNDAFGVILRAKNKLLQKVGEYSKRTVGMK